MFKEIVLSAAFLITVLGVIHSFLMERFAPFAKWFEPKPPKFKATFMGVFLLGIAGAVFGSMCANLLKITYEGSAMVCSIPDAFTMLYVYLEALAVQQGWHLLTKIRS